MKLLLPWIAPACLRPNCNRATDLCSAACNRRLECSTARLYRKGSGELVFLRLIPYVSYLRLFGVRRSTDLYHNDTEGRSTNVLMIEEISNSQHALLPGHCYIIGAVLK